MSLLSANEHSERHKKCVKVAKRQFVVVCSLIVFTHSVCSISNDRVKAEAIVGVQYAYVS